MSDNVPDLEIVVTKNVETADDLMELLTAMRHIIFEQNKEIETLKSAVSRLQVEPTRFYYNPPVTYGVSTASIRLPDEIGQELDDITFELNKISNK